MTEDCPCKIKYSCKMNINEVRDRVSISLSFSDFNVKLSRQEENNYKAKKAEFKVIRIGRFPYNFQLEKST